MDVDTCWDLGLADLLLRLGATLRACRPPELDHMGMARRGHPEAQT